MTRAFLSTVVGGAMLSIAGMGVGSPAAAHEDLQSFVFEYAPAGPDDCVVKVGLSDSGLWSDVQTYRLICNFTVGANWQVLPQKASAIFRMRAPSVQPPVPQPRAYDGPAWVAGDPMQGSSNAEVHFFYFQAFSFNADDEISGPINACQTGASDAKKNGADMRELLTTGFSVSTTAVAQLELQYLPSPHSHHPSDSHDDPKETLSVFSERLVPVTVRCIGDRKIAEATYPPPTRQTFRVTGARLEIRPVGAPAHVRGGDKIEAPCPLDLRYFGTIATAGKRPAEVKYRFRWASGPVSTVFSKVVNETALVAVPHHVPIPLPPAIKPQAGGGVQAGGGFAVLDPPGPGLPPQQPKGPTLAGTPTASNVHKDSVRLEIVSPHGGVVSEWARYHVECTPFVVTSTWLKYEIESKPTCPRKVTETVTVNANQAGKLAYEIRHQGGTVFHSGQVEVKKQGQKYVGVATRNLTLGAFDGEIMADIKNSPASSGWMRLKVECLELSGDFSFLDDGGTKCPRQGKALINFVTNMQNNVHYSLDCTNGHFSGVAKTVKGPQGGYVAPALVTFDIKKTTQANCALKTVAPGKAEVHSLKGHLFQCVTPTGVSGAGDLKPDSRPDPKAPGKPGRIIVDPPRIACVDGKVDGPRCVCPSGKVLQTTGKNVYRCAEIVKLQLTPTVKGCPKGQKLVNGRCIKPAG